MAPVPSGSDRPDTVIDLLGSVSNDPVPIDLYVKNLNYSVTDKPGSWWQKLTHVQMPWEWMEKGKTTHIIQDVTFSAKSGQLMAIMGGSGSGKTSLLDVLACRKSSGTITGKVYLNSVSRTKAILDSCAGYVRQDDRLIAFLTVRETLMFVAQLKLPRTYTKEMIQTRVNQVIAELGLKHAADTKVGDANIRGLSGGERRRVSIGIQLLILPSILFLDEPTSGLDSFTANNLVQTLSKIASKKRTVVMSIHQPRFDIFNIVDTMMILSKGRIVYNGPSKEMVPYFTTLGFPCPEHTNPCDFYIDLATVDSTSKEREAASVQVVRSFHDAYRVTQHVRTETFPVEEDIIGSEEFKRSVETSRVLSNTHTETQATKNDTFKNLIDAFERRRLSPGLLTQFVILFKRFIRVTVDDWPALLTHMIQALFMSMLLGVAYVDLKLDQISVRDWFGVMFMMSVMYPYMVILGLIGTCFEERRFLFFELQDKLYNPAAFYFAKILSDVPFHMIYVLIYCVPVYGIAGLKIDAYTCFMFYILISLSVFASRCLAMMVASTLPTFQIACVLAQSLFSLFIMSSGFLLNIDNIIPETRWMADINYLRWGFQALCIIEIEDLEFECNATATNPCIKTGSEALRMFSLEGGETWTCCLGLGGTIFVFLFIMLLGFKFISQKPHEE